MNLSRNSSPAFSLIEVTLALGIAAFCLLTVFGLLPLGLNSSQNAAEQTTVAGIATAISSDLHGAISLSSTSAAPMISSTGVSTTRFGFTIPGPGSGQMSPIKPLMHTLFFAQDGSPVTDVDADASTATAPPRYRATVWINQDPTLYNLTQSTTLYKARILITWPALADPTAINPPQYFAGSFETLTALNFSL
jgi:type II secretory pathway pseudopilin PulG